MIGHGFLFVHVPKTGGESVRAALAPYATPDPLHHHASARAYREHLSWWRWRRLYRFAFVRNPWDWHVSLWHYIRRSPEHLHHADVAVLDFPAYLRWRIVAEPYRQQDLLTDGDHLLVDHVGRFESLGEDFAAVAARLGIDAHLPHLNRSERGEYRDYYDEPSRRLVEDGWGADAERFGYSFD